MLPRSIESHPFFHPGIDVDAIRILKDTTEGNFLFCHGSGSIRVNTNFVLWYKAAFHGQQEIRCLTLRYDNDLKTIEHNSLGASSTLYSVASKLPAFLDGFAEGVFNPSPVYNPVTKARIETKLTSGLYRDTFPLIYANLDLPSIHHSMQVSKSWCTSISKSLFTIFQAQDQAEKIKQAEQRQKVMYVFEKIKADLPPDNVSI
jgi:hypothetical protein